MKLVKLLGYRNNFQDMHKCCFGVEDDGNVVVELYMYIYKLFNKQWLNVNMINICARPDLSWFIYFFAKRDAHNLLEEYGANKDRLGTVG